jgi:hypothetical protein
MLETISSAPDIGGWLAETNLTFLDETLFSAVLNGRSVAHVVFSKDKVKIRRGGG